MRIDGKQIAEEIFRNLKVRVAKLKEKAVTPKLIIVLVGQNPASLSYVKQKELKAKLVGIEANTLHLPTEITQEELLKTIEQSNNDNNVHGVIIQRPLPEQINEQIIDGAVDLQKDVDGFRIDSPFLPPLGIAVYKILENIYVPTPGVNAQKPQGFREWARSKKIVVLGKGKTGGNPVMQVLNQREVPFTMIDSKTHNPELIIREADIVIAAVGKPNIITKDMLSQGVTVIGVGMHRGEDGKLHGDYEEEDIKDIASMYTPIPGGVGPVNVAMLLENVVTAGEFQNSKTY